VSGAATTQRPVTSSSGLSARFGRHGEVTQRAVGGAGHPVARRTEFSGDVVFIRLCGAFRREQVGHVGLTAAKPDLTGE